jgi:hypothetical protein
MAHELDHDRQLAHHRAALLAGQEPRRLVALAVAGDRVAPRASRPSRGLQERQPLRKVVVAARVPGSAAVRSAPLPRARVAPPDNPRGIIRSRALWPAGRAAHLARRTAITARGHAARSSATVASRPRARARPLLSAASSSRRC